MKLSKPSLVNLQYRYKKYFANYIDGLHYTSHNLFSKDNRFLIMIYYDNFHYNEML